MRLALALAAILFLAAPVFARNAQLNVLVGTEVSTAGATTMSPALWAKLVGGWVGENVTPFKGQPTVEDCMRAKALYMVWAPFELKPRLPGTPLHVNDRIAAQSHVTVTNCVTKQPVFDQVISLESNPVSSSNQGDLEPASSSTWESAIRGTFRSHPIVFSRLARIVKISSPYVYIDADTRGLAIGQTLRIYAGSDGVRRDPPVILTIVDVSGRLVQARYDAGNSQNHVELGDLVEPYAGSVPLK